MLNLTDNLTIYNYFIDPSNPAGGSYFKIGVENLPTDVIFYLAIPLGIFFGLVMGRYGVKPKRDEFQVRESELKKDILDIELKKIDQKYSFIHGNIPDQSLVEKLEKKFDNQLSEIEKKVSKLEKKLSKSR
jgi:F0F1-type ATP synthase membrane subunit b/b'